jgi:hypothetical protein
MNSIFRIFLFSLLVINLNAQSTGVGSGSNKTQQKNTKAPTAKPNPSEKKTDDRKAPSEIPMDPTMIDKAAPDQVDVVSEDYGTREVVIIDEQRNPRLTYQKISETWNVSLVYNSTQENYYNKKGLFKNGKLILPMIFSANPSGMTLLNNLIALGIDNKYGLFNFETEKWQCPLEFDKFERTSDNFYIGRKSNKSALFDENGKQITDFKWTRISSSGVGNYFIVSENNSSDNDTRYGIYNVLTRTTMTPCIYRSISYTSINSSFLVKREDDLLNFISVDNVPKFKVWYQTIISNSYRRNYIVKTNETFGIIDDNEKIILPFEYSFIKDYPYNDGSYLAKNIKGKYGFVQIDGKITLPFDYDDIKNNSYGNLLSSKSGKCGLIQVGHGLPTEIVSCDYDDLKIENGNLTFKKNGKMGVMDNFGVIIIPANFDYVESINPDNYGNKSNLYILAKGDLYSVSNGIEEGASEKMFYKKIEKFNSSYDSHNNYNKTKFLKFQDKSGKWGLLDFFGKEVLKASYSDIKYVSERLAVFQNNGKFGIFDLLNSSEIISPEFDQIIISKDGYIGQKNNDFFKLNLTGKLHTKL